MHTRDYNECKQVLNVNNGANLNIHKDIQFFFHFYTSTLPTYLDTPVLYYLNYNTPSFKV